MAAIGCEAVVHRDRSTVGNGSKGSSRLSRRDQPWADDELPSSANLGRWPRPWSGHPNVGYTFEICRIRNADTISTRGARAALVARCNNRLPLTAPYTMTKCCSGRRNSRAVEEPWTQSMPREKCAGPARASQFDLVRDMLRISMND